MGFCKEYNEKTANQAGSIIPAEITVFEDRSFTFVLKTPPASDLLKKAAGLEKGSRAQKREKVGTLTRDDLKKIAEMKMKDLNANDIDAAIKMVEGTARSMGIEVSVGIRKQECRDGTQQVTETERRVGRLGPRG